jgi:hypothetical protein
MSGAPASAQISVLQRFKFWTRSGGVVFPTPARWFPSLGRSLPRIADPSLARWFPLHDLPLRGKQCPSESVCIRGIRG